MNASMEFAHKLLQVYGMRCKPLCRELHIPQTAFDILMFLANNPECDTARDIVEIRRIKATLVSVNVDRLVREGYLDRGPSPGDRRKILLRCTRKAEPIIARGRQMQNRFLEELFRDVDEEARAVFVQVMGSIERKLDLIREGEE